MDESLDIIQDKFYNKAIRFLSFRPRSEKEVRDNLKKLAVTEAQRNAITEARRSSRKHRDSVYSVDYSVSSVVDQVIQKLKEQNFLNDQEFAKWWIEQRTTFRPKGMRAIKIELRQKGISDEIIEYQISNIKFPISNEVELAKKLVEQRMPRYKNLPKQKVYERLARFLASRGFDFETIKGVLYEKLK